MRKRLDLRKRAGKTLARLLAFLVVVTLLTARPAILRSEKVVEQYKNGTTFRVYEVDPQGRRQGPFKEFNNSGTLRIKANYAAGQLHGEYIEYHKNGIEKLKTQYVKGVLQGNYEEYHTNKKPKLRVQYKNGLREGAFIELYDNGAKRISTTFKEGRRNGEYVEYRLNGTLRIKTRYSKGRVDGAYEEYFENGKLSVSCAFADGAPSGSFERYYETGKLWFKTTYPLQEGIGSECWNRDGSGPAAFVQAFAKTSADVEILRASLGESFTGQIIPYPKTHVELYELIQRLAPSGTAGAAFVEPPQLHAPFKAGKLDPGFMEEGLRQVQVYRALIGLPFEDMTLNDHYNDVAQHGAVMLTQVGHLDHTPPKPATMSEEFYKLAFEGTSRSNLHQGQGTLVAAVDGFMDDSDPSNIDRVGHRRWIMNPEMLQTGFGYAEGFAALYAHDSKRESVPDWDILGFPPPGYYPDEYFAPHYAWCLSMNMKHFEPPAPDDIGIAVEEVNAEFHPVQEVELNYKNVETGSFGAGPCIIFRPVIPQDFGKRLYRVTITGLRKKDTKESVPVQYVVEFFNLNGR